MNLLQIQLWMLGVVGKGGWTRLSTGGNVVTVYQPNLKSKKKEIPESKGLILQSLFLLISIVVVGVCLENISMLILPRV